MHERGPKINNAVGSHELGAEVIAINDKPDGSNINDGCGALLS